VSQDGCMMLRQRFGAGPEIGATIAVNGFCGPATNDGTSRRMVQLELVVGSRSVVVRLTQGEASILAGLLTHRRLVDEFMRESTGPVVQSPPRTKWELTSAEFLGDEK